MQVIVVASYAVNLFLCSPAVPASLPSHGHLRHHTQKALKGDDADKTAASLNVDSEFNQAALNKVDLLVRKKFWNAKQLPVWKETVDKSRREILAAKNLIELDNLINKALHSLNASHTQFLTINDETFYFLHCLFGNNGNAVKIRLMDFTGAITGGGTCSFDTVRYVLDGSPAAKSGVKTGDEIVSVNGQQFLGQASFWGTAGVPTVLKVKRKGEILNVSITPTKSDLYKAYVQAIKDSERVVRADNHVLGYIHYWVGGDQAHDALEFALSNKLKGTDGLIFDLRDGYGGAWVNDLDYFYRPANAYPEDMRYGKPVVALINGGVRSGKEALASSFKRSGRAQLIGERTAGAFLGGQFFDLGDRIGLYLAVRDAEYMGERLEGVGVSPDVDIQESGAQRGDDDVQYDKALQILQQSLAPGNATNVQLPKHS